MAKEVNKRVIIWLNQQGIEGNLKSIRAAIAKTSNELNKLPIGTEEWYRKSEKLQKLKKIYDDIRGSVADTKEGLKDLTLIIGGASAALHGIAGAYQKVAESVQQYVDAYAKLDDAMVSVGKYTGLTKKEIEELNEEFQKMDTRTPIEKLNALAADAGRLGITSKAAIMDFVEAADMINLALGEDLGDDAVKNIGKMATMFGESESLGLRGAMLATASAINKLGQSSAASEPFIMEFSARLAGVANTAGMAQADIMGIASALDQNMEQVERSATAVQKFLMGMAAQTDRYANLVGMPVEQFKKLVDEDMNQAFITVIDKLKQINESEGVTGLSSALGDLKLKGSGIQETLMQLASHTDQLREAQQVATEAYREGNSVIEEATAANSSAAAQIEKQRKEIETLHSKLGKELYPVYQKIVSSVLTLADGTVSLVGKLKAHKEIIVLIGGLLAKRIVQYTILIGKQIAHTAAKVKDIIVSKAQAVATNFSTIKLAAQCIAHDLATKKINLQIAAQEMLNVVMKKTPWGLIAAGITAAVVGITKLVERHREATKAVREFNEACSKEQAEAEYLFGKLKKAEKGTKDYNDALNKLKEAYPDIIQKHLDEEGALRNVEQAYKDVIKQVYAKIAAEKKEAADKSAISDNIETQGRESEAIREKLTKQGIPKSKIEDIVTEILNEASSATGYTYAFVDPILRDLEKKFGLKRAGTPIYSEVEALLKSQVETNEALAKSERLFQPYIDANDELKQLQKDLDEQIKIFQSQFTTEAAKIEAQRKILELNAKIQALKKKNEPEPEEEGGGGNYGSGSGDEHLADKLKKFEEKVAKMRRKDEEDTLEGWAKIRKKIENDYADVITEAKELYGEEDDGKHVMAIVDQKNLAITEAGEKYLKDAGDAINKMEKESEKWLNDASAASGEEVPPIMQAMAGTEKQWDSALATVRENIATLTDLKNKATNDEDRKLYEDALAKQTTAESKLQTDMAKAKLATLQKFIADESKLMDDESVKRERSGLSERKRLIAETEEEYKIKIEAKKREIAALQALDNKGMTPEEKAKQLTVLNNQLETLMKWQTEDVKKAGQRHNVWEDLINIDWANFSADWEGNLEKMTAALKEFADAAFDIFNSINQIQSNKEQAAFDEWSEIQDEKADRLKQQLEEGLISQAYYDAQMEQLQKEKEEKEKQLQHEQFEREKKAGIAQALIQGALAIVTAFAQMGPIAGAIAAAIVAATTALQVAAIASQVNPYAKGGFIRGEQMALMGEQGDEWVASNQLLEDRKTAPLIAALEAYQRGNRRAIDDLVTVEEPRWEKLSQSSRRLSRTFAGDSVGATNIYNTNTNNSVNADTLAVLTELQTMNRYLKDPKNRQAYISRKMQLEYEENENELKEMARL